MPGGARTNRRVLVHKILRSDDGRRYLCGYCALRARYRNFREDRIEEIIELETGTVYSQPADFFNRYGIFDSSALEQLQVFIHILGYLARTDHSFDVVEQRIISLIIGQYCGGRQKELIEEYAFTHKVNRKDYLNEVAKLAYMDDSVVEFLIKKAEELIGVDGKITGTEQELFDILRENL